jgi:hypothetical protein
MSKEKDKDVKALNLRIHRDLWYFLKMASLNKEISINEIMSNLISKYKENCEKQLTNFDTTV